MNKKILFGVIAVIAVLVIVFYPKDCGYMQGGYVLPQPFYSEECDCLGFKFETSGDPFSIAQFADLSKHIFCAGIPMGKKCFENSFEEQNLMTIGAPPL